MSPVDRALEAAIMDLLDRRSSGATICPSEAAKVVASADVSSSGGDEPGRELLDPARRAARRLAASGAVEITQRGSVVDPSRAKGLIRIRRSQR